MGKLAQIEQLATDIIEQGVCAELAASATQLVIGNGNLDADIVFVGEAPGRAEDIKGVPFVGAAGRFLDTMLAAADMQREDVYITNIVKYRPPNNRDPSPSEKRDFLPYLLRQLEIIEPKVVVTLGRHSMEYFLPDAKIGDAHGNAVKRKVVGSNGDTREWVIIPLYHPAAALYNGGMRTVLIDDFIRAVGFAKTL